MSSQRSSMESSPHSDIYSFDPVDPMQRTHRIQSAPSALIAHHTNGIHSYYPIETGSISESSRPRSRKRPAVLVEEGERLVKNRKSAKECRIRKKMRLQNLEEVCYSNETVVQDMYGDLRKYHSWCMSLGEGRVSPSLVENLIHKGKLPENFSVRQTYPAFPPCKSESSYGPPPSAHHYEMPQHYSAHDTAAVGFHALSGQDTADLLGADRFFPPATEYPNPYLHQLISHPNQFFAQQQHQYAHY